MSEKHTAGWLVAGMIITVVIATMKPIAADGVEQEFAPELFTDLGEPVHRNALYSHALGEDADGTERYYQAYKGNPWFLLSLDPRTGEGEEYDLECAGNPYHILWASNKKLYISTGGSGIDAVFKFDPQTRTLHDLGRPTTTEQVVWTLCEAEDGKLYGGTYPSAKLISIDLETDETADLGRISPDQPYIRFLDSKGPYVYCNAGPSKPAIWAYNIHTGDKTQILPDRLREGAGWGTAQKRSDGEVYCTHGGASFRIDGLKLEPVEELPPARAENLAGSPTKCPLRLADGSTITVDLQSGPEKRYFLRAADGEVSTVGLDYQGTATRLWSVISGPDGRIYGSTSSPITLFACDPQSGATEVLGGPIPGGQIYGKLWHQGKLYMSAYGKSRVTVWDPQRPWDFGAEVDSNPRYLGSCHIGRPSSLILAPDEKHLLLGGVPGYGSVGGVMSVMEPDEPSTEVIEGIVGEHSISAMVRVPDTDLICVGTTYRGGSASVTEKSDGRLVLWDYNKRETVFEGVPVAGEGTIAQLVCVDGKIFGTTADTGYLLVFDPTTRQVVHTAELGYGPGSLFGLACREADGMIYAISGDSILRIDPQDYSIERLATYPGMGFGLAFGPDSLYFCAETHLIKCRLPD